MVRVSEAGSVSLGSTACRLRAGHCVRLHGCSWMRNLGTGLAGLALATSTESTSARQVVFHDDSSAPGGAATAATSCCTCPRCARPAGRPGGPLMADGGHVSAQQL
jgi:hypothetical protein